MAEAMATTFVVQQKTNRQDRVRVGIIVHTTPMSPHYLERQKRMKMIEESTSLFTEREEQILTLKAKYYTHTEICTALSINRRTLTSHISNIRRKTSLRGVKLIKYAIEHGYGKQQVSA